MPTALARSVAMAATKDLSRKLKGYDFYEKILKSPKHIVAPMVDQVPYGREGGEVFRLCWRVEREGVPNRVSSFIFWFRLWFFLQSEYAWRILSNRYGAHLCYTPMLHARLFSSPDGKYKHENWQTGPHDRPLIAQFCANEPSILLAAAKLIEHECDAVDINLGCPQHIAKRGRYGAFLQDEWDLIAEMVKTLDEHLAVPVTVKIRVFPEVEKTIRYAKMIEAAGAQLLTVHGRLREQKGHKTGLADWEQIRAVKQAVGIPVFANGNILYKEDIDRCLEATGADGVMTAEGNLYNPGIFTGKHYASWKLAEEYLEICTSIPNSSTVSAIRGHLFKMFKPCLHEHPDLRTALGKVPSLQGMIDWVQQIKSRLLKVSPEEVYTPPYTLSPAGYRVLPTWCLQPYFRVDGTLKNADAPDRLDEESKQTTIQAEELSRDEEVIAVHDGNADAEGEGEGEQQAKNARKRGLDPEPGDKNKARRTTKKPAPKHPICTSATCANVASLKCAFGFCKGCCRSLGPGMDRATSGAGDAAAVPVPVGDKGQGAEGEGEKKEAVVVCTAHGTKKAVEPAEAV
ncbi:dihydrouridine synthase-domain-containing protein [Fimicolochytrium jonesii]|uniref:dihydrouridine synthase-domain-containing protein n=1 Tax=Fimicolochytrium jonesii TaxID=1396493 RepID=UPI0022FEABAD|nr:dihydrouridine synthase-domain-containing protein [Fimicolochytrium jonesii]KAI8818928.1 dihydrouridine synthase-domain-containing protein [Fimicolochytrium jonesii]